MLAASPKSQQGDLRQRNEAVVIASGMLRALRLRGGGEKAAEGQRVERKIASCTCIALPEYSLGAP